MATRLKKEEVLRIIRDNQSIADMSAFQQAVAGLVLSPAHLELQREKMRAHCSARPRRDADARNADGSVACPGTNNAARGPSTKPRSGVGEARP